MTDLTPLASEETESRRRGWFDEDHTNKRSVGRLWVTVLFAVGVLLLIVHAFISQAAVYQSASKALDIAALVYGASKGSSFGIRWAGQKWGGQRAPHSNVNQADAPVVPTKPAS